MFFKMSCNVHFHSLYICVDDSHCPTYSVSSELDKPTLKNVLKVLQNKVSDKWEDIGIQLDIEDGQLSRIKIDNAGDSRACLREMLRVWLKRINPPPSWSNLADALDAQSDEGIASQIRDKYC